ncbi:alkaline phosphatase family protein [uncultured Kordia sp.]|uniref:alkaline phosphatase family protein n=1 Tax=uncultured Kordia sp. TaxID=507699 RepID=UPI002636D495|nr:alkaline phosphatase family protein [uncultured Kordia sp.]
MEAKTPNPLDSFDHVVVLMLENRSFDNLLGYLYKDGVPEGKKFEGLQNGNYENPVPERAVDYTEGAKISPTPTDDYHQPYPDPGEVYQHVNTQLYNTVDAENIDVDASKMIAPFNLPNDGVDNPPMNGFVNDYINTLQALDGKEGKNYNKPTKEQYNKIMKCFTPESVNVLSTLAKEFAVFDHWFCSVPSQTWCNRAFWHAAASGEFVINPIGEEIPLEVSILHPIQSIKNLVGNGEAFRQWTKSVWSQKSLFDLMKEKGITYNIYAEQVSLTQFITGSRSLVYTVEKPNPNFDPRNAQDMSIITESKVHIKTPSPGSNSPLDPFFDDINNKTLPQYSFIEPKFLNEHNDQHPSSVDSSLFGETRAGTVLLGEKLIWDVYEAIKNSDTYRDNTLLIITYDEHGGCFDHVPPPKAVPPKANMVGEKGFKFDRLGVRVPMVMVSSHIEKNTIINDIFDHTSFIKTMCEKWEMDNLTDRDKNANSFSHVFSAQKRSSFPDIPEPKILESNADYTKDPLNDLQKSILTGAHHTASMNSNTENLTENAKDIENVATVGGAMEYIKSIIQHIPGGEF